MDEIVLTRKKANRRRLGEACGTQSRAEQRIPLSDMVDQVLARTIETDQENKYSVIISVYRLSVCSS